jgi:hypothetical protein
MLRKILIVVGVIVVGFAVAAAMQPAHFRVERSATMAAPDSVVFAQVIDFHKWKAWSPWAGLDSSMQETYSGPPSGVGASYAWAGNSKVGEGRMTILESTPSSLIRIKLEFLKPIAATNIAEYTFTPAPAGTEVHWIMTGDNNYIGKAIGMVVSMDRMVGGDFEKGLAQMKVVAEAAAGSSAPGGP